jgi:pimeloyl-ACP methyl ester carboxylesterase
MNTKRVSSYRTEADRQFVEDWIRRVQQANGSVYQRHSVNTSFGETVLFSVNHDLAELPPLVILPGARTFGMYWELNDSLRPLKASHRIYLVDVVGQPGLSSGNSPDVKTGEFGRWVGEVLDGVALENVNLAGASFGGELAMKFAAFAPDRIDKLILLNPIGFSYISFAPKSMFYNLLPIIWPTEANVDRFLDHIILGGGGDLTGERRAQLNAIILQTLKRFNFKADLPYKMSDRELNGWKAPTYLIVGEKDGLIPHQATVRRARNCAQDLREVHILPNIGHGIELSVVALEVVAKILAADGDVLA